MSANNLNDLLSSFQTDVELVHEFVKGDATVVVNGSDGSYPSLAKIAADALTSLGNFTTINQATLDALISAANSEVAALIISGQGVIDNSNAAIQTIVDNNQIAIDSIQAAETEAITNINNAVISELANNDTLIELLITNTQSTIDALIATANADIAALVTNSQIKVDNVLASARGTMAVVYSFINPSLSWNIKHNMNTKLFSTTIKNSSGVTVHENSIDIIDSGEFTINFTEIELGDVYVVYYLNCSN